VSKPGASRGKNETRVVLGFESIMDPSSSATLFVHVGNPKANQRGRGPNEIEKPIKMQEIQFIPFQKVPDGTAAAWAALTGSMRVQCFRLSLESCALA
jgi:hypothetical protein